MFAVFRSRLLNKGNKKMRMRLKWFVAPCVASMMGGTSLGLYAQDAPKVIRIRNVVVQQDQDGVDADGIRAKVAKELEKSGISEETKTRILKDLEDALGNAKAGLTKAKKVVEKESQRAKAAAKDATEEQLKKRMQLPGNSGSFTTQFFVSPKGDGYRIGIQCNAVETEDGQEVAEGKQGLEVQAVIDDSPAAKAGIVEGDFLMTVNGAKITKIMDLTKEVQEAGKEGKEITLILSRDEKVVSVAVKPTKMKSSDVELENIRLAIPTGGFVVDADAMKGFQQQMKKFVPEGGDFSADQVLLFRNDSADLKKEMAELKSEMADLKKLLKEMIDKK